MKTSGDRVAAPGCLVHHRGQAHCEPPCLVLSWLDDATCHLLEPDGSWQRFSLWEVIFRTPALLGSPHRSGRRNP